jgi:hypothetical protein
VARAGQKRAAGMDAVGRCVMLAKLSALIFTSWKTSILGILGILLAVFDVLRNWLMSNTGLDFQSLSLLILGLIGVFSKDMNKTGTPTTTAPTT